MQSYLIAPDISLLSRPSDGIDVLSILARGGDLVTVLEAPAYPRTAVLRVDGLRPARHYHVGSATHGFCRADEDGGATIELLLLGRTELIVAPVV